MDGIVESCPQNLTDIRNASTRLGCGRDKYGNDQYICLPNVEKTGLVELCHNGIMGIVQRGICLETAEGKLFQSDCSGFLSGCPDDAFRSNENYNYPACQRINTQDRCYLADPSCAVTSGVFTTEINLDLDVYNTTKINNQTITIQEYETADIGAIVGGLCAGVILLIVLLFLGVLLWRRKQRRKNKTKEPDPDTDYFEEKKESGSESDSYQRCTSSLDDCTFSTPLLPTYNIDDAARVTILKTGGLEKRELVFTETSVKSELKRRVHDVTEADTCSKPKEKNHGVTEASVNSKPENRTHGDTEAGVNSKPEGNVYGFQKAGINRESEEGVHGVIEAEFNSKPEERSHGNTETNVIEAGVNSEIEERVYGGTKAGVFETLDDYNTWKTNVSDQFSTLTDDEVSVLFCFLCSDSSPPDFTDKEWLDLLNVIRQIVYGKYNPVTSEEAQQTLDRLKSRDFLWEDKDKITKDTKDETMYRKASIDSFIPFFYSSYDTASVYLRSSGYNRKPGEKCVSSTAYCDDLLIRRLQMNILTHVIMEDTYIYDDIHQILNVKKSVQKDSIDEREKFVMDLRNEGEVVHRKGRSQDSVQHVTWLWRYGRPDIVRSCIGLHPHWDINIIDNKAYRKPSEYNNFSPEVRCLLYSLLLTEKYQLNLNEQSYRITRDKIRDRFFTFITDDGLVDLPDGITETHNGVISFISDDIRHDVMYAFVTECLVEDSDLEFFLATASRDVISEYCRSWKYERSEGERCLYIPDRPDKMYDLFIDKLQLDIITHCTVSDRGIHGSISKRLNIPEEILKWDTNARKRFAESLRHGRVEMFRARGMIVGCAGAGKTTLLRKLQRKHTKENQTTETTLGLEVHEDLFEIKDGTLYDFSVNDEDIPVARFLRHNTEEEKMVIKGILHHSSRGTKLISMTDFAGQVAYYACHQVYLSSRAFYIVVIDMSLGLDEEVRIYHTDRHNPEGSLFHSWKYKDYFHFWLQSIQTYCDVGKTHTSQESAESRGSFHPVIIVASHADKVKEDLQKMFYEELENCLSDEQSLKHLISPNRYLKIECPPNNLSSEQQDSVECLRKCIVKTVESMPQWGEVIPLKWANLEKVLNQMKENKKRVISVQYLKELKNVDLPCDKDLEDGLRFLHEIGQIVYFAEEKMKDVIIVDVQWFVDAFKYIITDEKHLAREGSKNILLTTGRITEYELKETWENSKNNYIKHIDVILPYMNKLGLMTKVQDDPNGHIYYIPSMNRTDFPKDTIKSREKTSIMVFRFKTYLPHFFFFRLVVNCLKEWEALEKKLYKNAAFYKVEDASHYIAIAVNKTSIQLQVFTPEGMHLQTQCVVQIRKTVASLLTEITQTFHRHIEYEIGYYCKDINITDEDEDFFISESDVMKVGTSSGKGQRPCPKHAIENVHQFDKQGILQFWV